MGQKPKTKTKTTDMENQGKLGQSVSRLSMGTQFNQCQPPEQRELALKDQGQPGVANPGCRENGSTLNTKTGW